MKNKLTFVSAAIFVASSVFLFSCASSSNSTTKLSEAYPAFYEEEPPVSILVMPPINLTDNVDAKDYFYYTLQAVLANRGYYSFPPLLSMQTLQENSAYDSEIFFEGDISKFGQLFGADLLLFTKISEWKKRPVGGAIDVTVEYIFRSTSTGETVYSRKGSIVCDTKFKSGLATNGNPIVMLIGLVVDAIGTAVKTGVTDYTAVARSCNYITLCYDLPAGKYLPIFGTDGDNIAGASSFKSRIAAGTYADQVSFDPLVSEEKEAEQSSSDSVEE